MKTKIVSLDKISLNKNYRYLLSRSLVVVLFCLSILVFITGCDVDSDTDPLPETSVDEETPVDYSVITLTSTDFTDGGDFSLTNYGNFASYTPYLGAGNLSPQLSWVETNTEVKSHILLMVDRSANDWVHWFRVNIDTNFLAQGVGSTAGNDQGFVTHYGNGGIERKYYGPQPPSGTHNYDILMFGVDQEAVDISKLADYAAMESIYSNFIVAYTNSSNTPQEVTLGGTTVKVLSKGKITGTATKVDLPPVEPPAVTDIVVSSTDFTDGGDFSLTNYGNFASYTPYLGAGNLSPQLSWVETNTNVKSHILLMVDRSANDWVHWFRVNIDTNFLAQGVGSTAGNDQGFVTHYGNGGIERKYYGPQPPSGTHNYDILMFGVDQEAVDISKLADYAAMESIYSNFIVAYTNSSNTPQEVTLGGTTVKVLSKGKITGTATKVDLPPVEPPAVTDIVVSSTDFTDGGDFSLTNYGNFASYTPYLGAGNLSPQLSWVETNTNVKSHILLMVDRSANDWVHWFRVNIDTNFLAQGVGSTAGNDQGFVTHYGNGGIERKYYGPQPPSGTHNYDILMFGVDQEAVDISELADYGAMEGIYKDLIAAYDNTSSTPQEVTITGTPVKILSKGKITGTAP